MNGLDDQGRRCKKCLLFDTETRSSQQLVLD